VISELFLNGMSTLKKLCVVSEQAKKTAVMQQSKTSGQIIFTKGRIAGLDFLPGTTTSRELCSRLHQ